MSFLLKNARHPNVSEISSIWSGYSSQINTSDNSSLSDVPLLASSFKQIDKMRSIAYLEPLREIVGASAIRSLAKCYEALDALKTCDQSGVSTMALVVAYDASFFAARSFCMLSGFAPLDRDSKVTIDVFPTLDQKKKSGIRVEDNIVGYSYTRWGHEEVWSLTDRLLRTAKVPTELEASRQWLKKAKLKNSSKFRNRFLYDDRCLTPITYNSYADFPSRIKVSILEDKSPDEIKHQYLVADHICRYCNFVLDKSNLVGLLHRCISKSRIENGFYV